MDSSLNIEDASMRYQGYFCAIYKVSKRWWAVGTASTIVALFPVPILSFASGPRWYGVIAACVLAVVGKCLGWKAGVLAGEAEAMQRMDEHRRFLGWPEDKRNVGDMRAKYRWLDGLAERVRAEDYYEHGKSTEVVGRSAALFARHFRESSWWTAKLAKKCARTLWMLLVALIVAWCGLIVGSWMIEVSVIDGVLGLVVGVIIASDLVILLRRYVSLERSSENAFGRINDEMVNRNDESIDNNTLLAVVGEYMISRSCGPPIPEVLYRRNKARLNQLWSEDVR